ncbi:MAG: HWE histidine kinase domain-containing protein [Parvibaculaceae bacterium]
MSNGRRAAVTEKQERTARTTKVDLARELEISRRRFKTAIDLAGVTLYGLDRELRYTWVISAKDRSTGIDMQGARAHDVLDKTSAALVLPAKRAALETGETQRVEFPRAVDGEHRWFDLRIEAEKDADGEVVGLICASIDVTDRKRWEEHQRVLLMELAHRSKNLLAVVQSLANQSGQNSSSVDEFKKRFFGRLQSLSRAHEILSDQNWRGAGMRELIRSQVLMYVGETGERVSYEGPPIYLRPNAAQHVGLALHELTTNAIKHGALRDDTGDVSVTWEITDAKGKEPGLLTLLWTEKHSHGTAAPNVRNFGRILLETVVPAALEGSARLSFGKTGVVYELTIPSGELA